MQGRTTLVKRAGVVTGAELGCSVREENQVQRESYSAAQTQHPASRQVSSITINTQPQDRQTVQEADDSRRETFSRQWEARRLLQACPSGVIRLGTLERGVREHQQLPYRKSLPLPLFTPTELGTRLGRGAPHTQEDLRPLSALDGACPAKRDVGDITKDLPPVKPIRMEFAKAPKSLGRSMSQEAQRG
ncbi:hypothetical protein ANANG_G00042090 [Anguilla anguilla]|uniref:Uncharacterized protein n=1 Tax=Anguilla anguilla TaxID=7936 RepID=A0A9D3MU90_ANGAN|nr:hypothetical protein ANANG_G00042090 [Anguilla anguilla]